MPFETEAQVAERKVAKARRAKELAARQRELLLEVQAAHLQRLRSHIVRGLTELGALLGGMSPRAAFEVARRPGFPRARALGDRTQLWLVAEVLHWLGEQGAVE